MGGPDVLLGDALETRGVNQADALAHTAMVGEARYHTSIHSKMEMRNRTRGKSFMSSLQHTRVAGINLVGSADGKNVFTPPLASEFMTNASSVGAPRGPTSGPVGHARQRLGASLRQQQNETFYEYDILGANSTMVATSGGPFSAYQRFEDRPKPIDHHQRNLNNIKFLKNQSTEKSKYMVRQIHNELRAHYLLGVDPARLTNVHALLRPQVKQRFLHVPGHRQLANYLSELNKASVDLYDQLKCYKLDIAGGLEQILQCYNAIFI